MAFFYSLEKATDNLTPRCAVSLLSDSEHFGGSGYAADLSAKLKRHFNNVAQHRAAIKDNAIKRSVDTYWSARCDIALSREMMNC
jgi:hypothetical protein